jgi:hypothetical protein
MPHAIYGFLPDGTVGEEQVEVADEHPEASKAELGRVVGIHFVDELGWDVCAFLNEGEAFGFAALDAAALFVDDDVMVETVFFAKRPSVTGIDGVNVETSDFAHGLHEEGQGWDAVWGG